MADCRYNILFDMSWHIDTEKIIHYDKRMVQVKAIKLSIIYNTDQYLKKQETVGRF